MFSTRNLGGVALFLFGTTFLWITSSFASKGVPRSGSAWTVTNVFALAAMAGFAAASFGLFAKASWWEGLAIGSAVIGVIAVVPYWIAASHAGETNPLFNVIIHLVGDAGVFALLLIPQAEQWVEGHVLAGR